MLTRLRRWTTRRQRREKNNSASSKESSKHELPITPCKTASQYSSLLEQSTEESGHEHVVIHVNASQSGSSQDLENIPIPTNAQQLKVTSHCSSKSSMYDSLEHILASTTSIKYFPAADTPQRDDITSYDINASPMEATIPNSSMYNFTCTTDSKSSSNTKNSARQRPILDPIREHPSETSQFALLHNPTPIENGIIQECQGCVGDALKTSSEPLQDTLILESRLPEIFSMTSSLRRRNASFMAALDVEEMACDAEEVNGDVVETQYEDGIHDEIQNEDEAAGLKPALPIDDALQATLHHISASQRPSLHHNTVFSYAASINSSSRPSWSSSGFYVIDPCQNTEHHCTCNEKASIPNNEIEHCSTGHHDHSRSMRRMQQRAHWMMHRGSVGQSKRSSKSSEVSCSEQDDDHLLSSLPAGRVEQVIFSGARGFDEDKFILDERRLKMNSNYL
eukprot:m.28388 g.28388  ORF g.28388 m.28388 type:complete len:451 (-) comp10442_c2_seq1:645-1997(-)